MMHLNYKIIVYVQTEVRKISNSNKHICLHPVIFVSFRDVRKCELYDCTEEMNRNVGGTKWRWCSLRY